MKPPFFLSAPRTRSSILYESTVNYCVKKYGFKTIRNYPEPFNEFWPRTTVHDTKYNKNSYLEMTPFLTSRGVQMHGIYPFMFNSVEERNKHKIKVLKEARDLDIELYFKGTYQLQYSPEIYDFYKDRLWIITKRKDISEQTISFIHAKRIGIYSYRNSGIHKKRYEEKTSKKIFIDLNDTKTKRSLQKFIEVAAFGTYKMEKELADRGIDYMVTYYEDLQTDSAIKSTINNILQDDRWEQGIKHLPIKREKDYSDLIQNYSELKSYIESLLRP